MNDTSWLANATSLVMAISGQPSVWIVLSKPLDVDNAANRDTCSHQLITLPRHGKRFEKRFVWRAVAEGVHASSHDWSSYLLGKRPWRPRFVLGERLRGSREH